MIAKKLTFDCSKWVGRRETSSNSQSSPPHDGWSFDSGGAIEPFGRYYVGPPRRRRCKTIAGVIRNPVLGGVVNMAPFNPLQGVFIAGRQVKFIIYLYSTLLGLSTRLPWRTLFICQHEVWMLDGA